jgi:exopolysaccharide biosynthesis polyprenyl glycosylphosphotransferase
LTRRTWQIVSVVLDVIFINLAIVLAFLVRFKGHLPYFNFRAYSNLAIFITLIQLSYLYFYELYEAERSEGFSAVFSSVVKAVSMGTISIVALTFFVGFLSFPRLVFLISWLLMIVLLISWRLLTAEVLKINWPKQRILVVGTGNLANQVIAELKARSDWGYEVIGAIGRQGSQVGKRVDSIPIVGTMSNVVSIIREKQVNRLIVTRPINQRELLEELARSSEGKVKVEIVPDLYEIFIGTVDHNLLSDIPLVELTKKPVSNLVIGSKILIDKLGSLFLLILLSPIFLVITLLIKFTSKGPVIYKQKRVGKEEKNFYLYKFRTMVENAEQLSGPVLASENDKRITPIGYFLRRYRLDELPQLVNILKGNMSFVGPRPERPFFVNRYKEEIPGYAERFKIKPGVTGLAQVSGSYATTPENKLRYDLIYIYHQSIFLDLKVLFKTIKVVLTGSGSR